MSPFSLMTLSRSSQQFLTLLCRRPLTTTTSTAATTTLIRTKTKTTPLNNQQHNQNFHITTRSMSAKLQPAARVKGNRQDVWYEKLSVV